MWYQAHLPPMTLRQHAAAQSMCCSAGAIVPQHSPQQAHALTLHRCAGPQWGTSQGPQRPPYRGASAAAPPPSSSYRAVARTAAAGPHSGSSCNNSVACVGLGYWSCVRLSLLVCVAVCRQSESRADFQCRRAAHPGGPHPDPAASHRRALDPVAVPQQVPLSPLRRLHLPASLSSLRAPVCSWGKSSRGSSSVRPTTLPDPQAPSQSLSPTALAFGFRFPSAVRRAAL